MVTPYDFSTIERGEKYIIIQHDETGLVVAYTSEERLNVNSINKNGCSTCQPCKENYTTYTTKLGRKRVRMYQYDYRTESGELFSCCAPTLEACRKKLGEWLKEHNYGNQDK